MGLRLKLKTRMYYACQIKNPKIFDFGKSIIIIELPHFGTSPAART
jgi:hypothetical protein